MAPLALAVLALSLTFAAPAAPAPTPWVAATPDELVDLSLAAARQAGATPAGLARLTIAVALADEAQASKVLAGLQALAASGSPLAAEARWLAAVLSPRPWSTALRPAAALSGSDSTGLVRHYAVLGPFPQSGGGLDEAAGPETAGHDYRHADCSQGSRTIRYVQALPESATARGLPLDLYLHPRDESCSFVESAVSLGPGDAARKVTVHVAATGSFKLRFDGVEVLRSEESQPELVVDRAAVRLLAGPGRHLLTLKICSSASADSGRVRLRFTGPGGGPLAVQSSSELAALQQANESRRGATAASLRAQPVVTLLERGLAVGASPTADAALVAAVLRILGGAEDLQSPRASGLLDQVVATEGLSLDRLALAGAIAPFATQRSGWLDRAYQLAGPAGADQVASFALRELVKSRLQAGLRDSAYATARLPLLSRATDPHARWLRAFTKLRLGGAGLRAGALRELRELGREQGSATPSAVLRSLAGLSADRLAGEHLLARQQLAAADVAGSRDQDYVAAFQPQGLGAVTKAAGSVLALQDDARDVVAIGHQLLDAGGYQAAVIAFELAVSLSPNLDGGHRGLAQALFAGTDSKTAKARHRRALAALRRAKELDPGDAQLSAEIEYRQRGGVEPAAQDRQPDERFIVKPEEFLARARQNPLAADAEVSERELHWRRVVTYHDDQRVSQLAHYAREIVIEPRTIAERYEDLPFGDLQAELLLARVHRPDGSVAPPEEQDLGAPSVLWPKLRRGDVVEVALRAWTEGPIRKRGDVPFFFSDFAGSVETQPLLYNEVVIDAPAAQPLPFDVIGGQPDRRLTAEEDGRRITRLIWDRPPVVPDEPLAPPLSELAPVVVGSGFASWDEFMKWYTGAVAGFAEPDEQIKRLAADLTKGKRRRDDKVAALFRFVADDIRYVNYVSGEWWLPNRPQQLLAKRQGDCDDKALLLISLLKAVGIEATEVLIQTRLQDRPRMLRAKQAAIPLFDHGIIYLPDESGEGGRFLDATSPQSRIGSLPAMDAGASALLVRGGAVTLLETPLGGAETHGISARWTLELTASGGGRLRAAERHTGDAAFQLRTYLQEADARAQWVEQNLVGGWFPTVRIDPEITFDGELEGGAATIEYQAESDSLGRREGDDLVVVVAPSMPVTATLAPLTARQLPVWLPPSLAPRHQVMEVTIVAPAGYAFADLPPDSPAQATPFGSTELTFTLSRDKQSVLLRRAVSFTAARIAVADYPAWRAWLQRIDRLLQRGVRLRRTVVPAN